MKKLIIVAVCAALIAPAMADIFTFDAASDGAAWNGSVTDQPTDTGNYFLSTTGAGIVQELNGNLTQLEYGGTSGDRSSTMVVTDATATARTFTVNSLGFRNAPVSGVGSLTGLLGGVVQWTITDTYDADPTSTVSAPTTGSFALEIDSIQWDVAGYVDSTGGQKFDDLDINVVAIPEPATIGMFAAFGAAGLFIRRRMMI